MREITLLHKIVSCTAQLCAAAFVEDIEDRFLACLQVKSDRLGNC